MKELISETEEQNCEVTIFFRGDKWGANNELSGIQLNIGLTPLYCCNCKTQVKNLYQLDSSRYGFVGTVNCPCGAQINCTDSDNLVDFLNTSTMLEDVVIDEHYIDYPKVYKLENRFFFALKEKTGFDVFSKYGNTSVDLKTILHDFELANSLKISTDKSFSSEKFDRLPKVINTWFTLLESLK